MQIIELEILEISTLLSNGWYTLCLIITFQLLLTGGY